MSANGETSLLAPIPCSLTGLALLQSPLYNKGAAFTKQERRDFDLVGLLPSNVATLEEQAQRAMQQYQTHRTEIGRNIFLTSMKEQNVVLYYRLLQDHLKEMFSIIYTPTEGEAIANYSRIFRKSEGCFLDISNMDDIETSLSRWNPEDIDIIACSDGEQILGRRLSTMLVHWILLTFRVQALATKVWAPYSSASPSWSCIRYAQVSTLVVLCQWCWMLVPTTRLS